MTLSLPIYLRGSTYVLHTRIGGRQLKRSLRTADPRVARLRAIQLLGVLRMATEPKKVWTDTPLLTDFTHLTPEEVRRYDLDIRAGRLKTDGTQADPLAAMDALEAMKGLRDWEAEFDDIPAPPPAQHWSPACASPPWPRFRQRTFA